jgi:cell wall-associated NlpC family hydrolase
MSGPNKRLHAYRPDLAEFSLKGKVEAARFVEGETMQVVSATASIFRQPANTSMQLTQALFGEKLTVFDQQDGWAWVKLWHDGYVGYMPSSALSPTIHEPTHEVATLSTFLYPKADIKTQPAINIPMLSRVAVKNEEKDFVELATGGYIFKRHLRPVNSGMGDYVSVAERFLFAPYYWGGKTIHGLDCSGLVQVALQSVGGVILRDSDMQEASLGQSISQKSLRRGDLIFWDGHVGIMADHENLLHANGTHMMVALEPLKTASDRIAATGKAITSIKRL